MYTEWLFYGLSGVIGILMVFLSFRRKCEHKLPPSYPGKLPLIGHAHQLLVDPEKLMNKVDDIARHSISQGGVTTFFVGTRIFYVVTDPEDALTVANACLDKGFTYKHAKLWLGEGLITSAGETWKRHRRLLNPAFGLPVINNFLEVFNSTSRLLVKDFEDRVGKGLIDPTMDIRIRALEAFCLTSFGVYAAKPDFIHNYMEAVDKMMMLLTLRFCKPIYQNNFIYKLSGWQKEEEKYVGVLNSLTTEIMEKKKREAMSYKTSVKTEKKYKPLLDLLMELSNSDVMTGAEIKEEVDTAIIAGFDTTSSQLVLILLLLGSFPCVQEKVYKEIIDVVGLHRDVEKDDVAKLEYTEAVIKESIRYYSIGPTLFRYVDKDVKLKNYILRAGSELLLMPFGTHRHPVWGQDCEEFKPERWLDAASLPNEATAYGGFSWGKRRCIGKIYALITIKVTIAHFIRQYKITSDYTKLRRRIDFIVKPISGHEISLERRQ